VLLGLAIKKKLLPFKYAKIKEAPNSPKKSYLLIENNMVKVEDKLKK
jgi:hypothetical protein